MKCSKIHSYNNLCSPHHSNFFFHQSFLPSCPGFKKEKKKKKRCSSSEVLSLSIAINERHAALAAYFKHQRLISRPSSVEALRLVERALVIEHGPTKVELPWPVHGPVPCQVVLPLQGPDGQIAGGHLHLLDVNASSPSGNRHHGVILWKIYIKRRS